MVPTGHYWFALRKFLQDIGMRLVYVNPHRIKKSKKLDDNTHNKNERKDPKTIAAYVNEGRLSYLYLPTSIYAEIKRMSKLRFQTQEMLTRIKNRIARLPSTSQNTKTFMGINRRSAGGWVVLKEATLPEDIQKLGVEDVNRRIWIWRAAKLRGTGMKRAKTLVSVAVYSVGSKEASGAARLELRNLLDDIDVYASRLEKILRNIEERLKEIPYVDKLMGIKGSGLVTISGFIAEVDNIGRFDNQKQLHKLA